MNFEDKRKIKIGIYIATAAILVYLVLQNIDKVFKFGGYVLGLLTPFIIGLGFAFVLNILMRQFEDKVFARLNHKNKPIWNKLRRPVCLVITIIIFLGIVATLLTFVLPQLARSVTMLIDNIPTYMQSLEEFANQMLNDLGLTANIRETVSAYWSEIVNFMTKFLGVSLPKMFEYTISVTTGLFNVFLGFIIGIYMLSTKEKLIRNCKQVLFAFVPQKPADSISKVFVLTQKTFNGFVTGQLTEALIVGVLCYIGMIVFRMEYALLISVIVGFTNIIPIFGPIIGTVPGAFILLLVDPMKAVWFVVFVVILQQVESNLIYPRVVGGSIGLPPLWVMFAILVGGSVFGLIGVLLGVPTFAVIYTVFASVVKKRVEKKKMPV